MQHELLDDNLQLVQKIVKTLDDLHLQNWPEVEGDYARNRIKTELSEWFGNRLKELEGFKSGKLQVKVPPTDHREKEDLPRLKEMYKVTRGLVECNFDMLIQHIKSEDDSHVAFCAFLMNYLLGYDKPCIEQLKWILHLECEDQITKQP